MTPTHEEVDEMEMAWHTWNGGPWFLLFPLFWLLVIVSAFWVFRRGRGWHHGPTAEDVLAERYARGEISVEEFEQRRQVLRRAR